MNSAHLAIELLEDTVISATAATAGAHASLDYIPGSALLGAAASRLYRQLGAEAFGVFHGDRARFGDARPLVEGRPAWPVPLAWHERKLEPARSGLRLDAGQIVNLVRCERPAGQQLKQLRGAHVDLRTGAWVRPELRLRMKTALEQGRVAEGQLFGYEALPAGSRFVTRIDADNEELLEALVAALEPGVLLGRSRSAEYGNAQVERIAEPDRPAVAPLPDSTVVYLASDLCLLDELAQPCLDPEGRLPGLGGLGLDHDRSFIRHRAYAPWNARRRAPDCQRQVISRGSVLVFEGRPDADALEALAADGAGLYRVQGLGEVLVDPDFLCQVTPAFEAPRAVAAEAPPERPATPLVEFLVERAGERRVTSDGFQRAGALSRRIERVLHKAREAAGKLPQEPFGPSASQWAKLTALEPQPDPKTLLDKVFGANGLARPEHANWGERIWLDNDRAVFVEWLRQQFENELKTLEGSTQAPGEQAEGLRRIIEQTARLARTEARS